MHMAFSWINLKQARLHTLVFTLHIRTIIIALSPHIINIKNKKANALFNSLKRPNPDVSSTFKNSRNNSYTSEHSMIYPQTK
jgi:hypothetical protein